tara:strand:- start:258 stop:887 length:630 start_codon:yes stop_codon:yes gene_type:complete
LELLIATSNPHKVQEIKQVLEPCGIVTFSLDSLDGSFKEPIENASTFRGNAKIKAVGYAKATGRRCIADDSGLSVDALGGEPGVYSARFAGIGENREERDKANNELLLKKMKGVPKAKRSARFVCAMCVADPDGSIIVESTGLLEGFIATSPSGTNGFGYDSLLFIPEVNKTSAELEADEKNAISHRGEAVRHIASYFSIADHLVIDQN